MKSDIFHYEDIFQFSDETYFIHKSPFSAFLKKNQTLPQIKRLFISYYWSLSKKCFVIFEPIIHVLYFSEFRSVLVSSSLYIQKTWKRTKISSKTEVLALW